MLYFTKIILYFQFETKKRFGKSVGDYSVGRCVSTPRYFRFQRVLVENSA